MWGNNAAYYTQLTKSLWMKPLDARYFMAEQIWTAMSIASMISVFLTSSVCCLKYCCKQPNGEGRRGEREEEREGGREREEWES
jgi:hypothetical protein